MTPKRKPLKIETPFDMPKNYRHVSILYSRNEVVGIIEAEPPRTIWCACDIPHGSDMESKSLDWTAMVMNAIRKDNDQPT